MGILERLGLRSSALDAPTDPRYETHINFVDLAAAVPEMTVEQLWREQPHLRTVTSFIARMVATVSLHVYERMEDGGRARVRDSYLAQLMHKPNEFQTLYRFLFDSVMDFCLYDEFVWYIDDDPAREDRFRMYRIPPSWIVHTKWDDPWHLTHVAVNFPTREPLVCSTVTGLSARMGIRHHRCATGIHRLMLCAVCSRSRSNQLLIVRSCGTTGHVSVV